MDNSIALRRDRAEERGQEIYEELFNSLLDQMRAEWIEQFGDNPVFPFRPNMRIIHDEVTHQMAAMKQDD